MDTDPNVAFFTDEEISMTITEQGTYKKAVLALLNQMRMLYIQQGDVKADWFNSYGIKSAEQLGQMIAAKRVELGLSAITSSAVHRYRRDFDEDSIPSEVDS
jgi:hypothetical protein